MLRALCISIFLICLPAVAKQKDDGSQIQADNFYPRVKIETSMGDITVELDRSRAPIAVNNFLRYVDKRSYEDTIFHRIVANFVVQGGGYDVDFNEKPSFPDIINESGNGLKNEMYTIAMARQKDPHSSNRQFFFNMNDNVSLDPGRDWGYTVFGYVVEGTDALDAISLVETDYDTTWGWADVPVEPVIIKRVTVLPPV
ncbi:peptidylprolyl isomerase [Paraglaciecola chathamensis]|jgi:peptidyl-prolyl cis-trans isomerase A (cyclophilin A)|uniref:Peptidyl-prolyl cis-trans isomerase n=3 Tax=Paraglaciecola chathamensis TaxID=368405 RepID=A0ABS0WAW0_9ALTE|nr:MULTISPECIES: peptidylprolyl isomerase [Paraglaciecola]MBJ2135579.1 peptidylprolyl isomerase [Paraglaciecola chathamensis]MBU3019932.1 peptidylprolyl isomerase [Paraglaciecola agarilytica]MDO6559068.1 peptidylprolyl isomerase [Paraglaciecola chathamensis]MDO6839991.1 peptidylprolyl isomerase [Paraglaciecola chathamensis]GAC04967.1 peptidyl-prolyl cis-trans isomerase A [Paraglaciecola agarilytica NO2]